MGNTPSTTPKKETPTKKETTKIAPCDLNCQKAKDLALLKTAYEKAAVTQDEDPAGYEKARVAYFTLLNGPGWLAEEKTRIARQEVEPVLTDYRTRFNAAKAEQKSMMMFSKMMEGLQAQEQGDQEDNAFLQKQVTKQEDQATTLERLNELGGNVATVTQTVNYTLSYIIDLVILLLSLLVIYLLYKRFTKPASSPMPSVMNTAT